MEVRGMKILALGVDDSEGERNVAVSLFDVTDPYNADMLDRVRLGGEYAYSAANWEPKALTIDDNHNIVIVPYSSYSKTDYRSIYGVQMVKFDLKAGELTLKGSAESDYSIDRTRVVDDYVLATSFRTLQVIDIDDLDKPDVVKVIDLCININDIIPMGNYYLQLVLGRAGDNYILRTVEGANDLEAVDTKSMDLIWAKFIETPNGVLMVATVDIDRKSYSKLYQVGVGKGGLIVTNEVGSLPDGIVYRNYGGNYYYDDVMVMEDGIDAGRAVRDMAYPYYDNQGSDKFILMENKLVYYHIDLHFYTDWEYNDTYNQYIPVSEKIGKDNLYIFDLEDLSDGAELYSMELETYSYMGLTTWKDNLYVQHKFNGVEIIEPPDEKKENEYVYYYVNYYWYYKNYVKVIDCSDLSNLEVTGDYNVPGKMIGAGDGVIFTLSEWYDFQNNVTINTLSLDNGSAVITSAVKIGTSSVDVIMDENKAYIMSSMYNYYYYRGYEQTEEINTTFQVIDFSSPNEPVKVLTATLDGYLDLINVENGHIVFYDSYKSAVMVYSASDIPELNFEAMILAQGGYNNMHIYEDAIYIPQGYYGVTEAYF
jgi:hypothetical protein